MIAMVLMLLPCGMATVHVDASKEPKGDQAEILEYAKKRFQSWYRGSSLNGGVLVGGTSLYNKDHCNSIWDAMNIDGRQTMLCYPVLWTIVCQCDSNATATKIMMSGSSNSS
jgi:hypothetical protein